MMRAPVRAGLFTCAVLLAAVLVGPPALPVAREAVGRTSGGRADPAATVLAVLTRVPRPPSAQDLFPTPPAGETPTAGAAATDPTEPVPGYAKGAITNSVGQPLVGGDVTVAVYGTTMAGEDTSFETAVDAQGRYSLRVPDGLYRVEAWVTVPLEGGRHIAELHPVNGEHDAYQDAAEGVVEDFRWAISGRKPGTAGGDGTYPGDYYGGSLWAQDAFHFDSFDSERLLANRYPADARIVLTLMPRGPMVDGSPGEPFVAELDLQGRSLANPNSSVGYVVDVPLGAYVATAVLVTPDGAEVPLKLSTGFGDDATYGPSLDIDFRPDGEYWIATFELTVTDL